MNEIDLQYVYTEAAHLDLTQELRRGSGWWIYSRVILLVGLVAFAFEVIILVLYASDPTIDWSSQMLLLTIGGMCLAMIYWQMKFLPKQIFKKTPTANTAIHWKITEKSIEFADSSHRVAFEWQAFTKIRESAAGFLLYIQPYLAYWISKPAFHSQDELELFRSWIQMHKVKFLR